MANEDNSNNKAEAYRDNLANFADNKKTRVLMRPSDWRPYTVMNPISGLTFTDAGAWTFIAELLRQGERIEVITLDNPPGQEAYVMKHIIEKDKPALYIKIHFGNGKVIGRSFHYSEDKTKD